MEGAIPAGLVEDVGEDVDHEPEALADAVFINLIGGSFKGPVYEHRAADDVFPRHEAPEAAIQALGAVVAHGKNIAGRNDEVAVLNVIGEIVGPAGSDVVAVGGRDAGKVVAIGAIGVLGVAVVHGHASVGFVLGDAVQVDDTVAEMDVVAGDGDGALDQEEVRLAGLEEDDDIAALDVAIEDEGCPGGGRSERDTIDQNVIADKQGLLHGGGGDFEVLEDEGHDEETDGEDGADRGQGLERGLGVVVRGGHGLRRGLGSS